MTAFGLLVESAEFVVAGVVPWNMERTHSVKVDIQPDSDLRKQAAINRALFRELGLTAISLCSAPRAGKTTILERTLPLLQNEFNVAVLETDLQPRLDAERIRSAGAPVWQIVTGIDRRPDAGMVAEALQQFPLARTQVLLIERLIDPDEASLPDWGEDLRVMVYRIAVDGVLPPNMPNLLRAADAVVVNTMDCPFHGAIAKEVTAAIRKANPDLAVFGSHRPAQDNLMPWISWLRQKIARLRSEKVRGAATSR